MKELFERLYKEQDFEKFQQIANEIQAETEKDPAASLEIIDAERAKVSGLLDAANQEYQDAAEIEAVARGKFEAGEIDRPALNEAKAAAWDAYWKREDLRAISQVLYDNSANAAYILANKEGPDFVASVNAIDPPTEEEMVEARALFGDD